MRIYTKERIEAGIVITSDQFNNENSNLCHAVNENIDAHNLPIEGIDENKLESIDYNVYSYGVWADHYRSTLSGADYLTSLSTKNLRTATHKGVWFNIDDDVSSAKLEIDLAPGIIRGDFVVDFEKRFGYNSPGYTVKEGQYQWIDWGLFIDDRLIIQSGPIYPRRYTVVIPYLYPTSGGTQTFEIKYRVRTNQIDATNSEYAQTLKIYSAHHFIRNQKR